MSSIAGAAINAVVQGKHVSLWIYWFPPLSYARTAGLLVMNGGGKEFWKGTVMMVLSSIVCLGAAVWRVVRPNELIQLYRCIYMNVQRRVETIVELELQATGLNANHAVDPDVKAEQEEAARATNGGEMPCILVDRLIKTYTATSVGKRIIKRAVNELCLCIQPGEVFGLLGPNGAGKTTCISILTGLTRSDGGSACIAGYDVGTQLREIHRVIGVCPQFDKIWNDLSVRSHLEFYALQKGIPLSRRSVAARQAAEKVQLDGDDFEKPARSLSGGMRRRLSIAIAILNNPLVLFFDEPTTGLDPETRRQVWRVLAQEHGTGRTTVVTTHSMEEADALCTRIGIMCGGNLRCIGAQLYLKSKFGDGFKLSLSTSLSDVELTALMREISPEARVISTFGTQQSYSVPTAGADVGRIFNAMERAKRARLISEWGISQASLDEVFINVTTAYENEVVNSNAAKAQAALLNSASSMAGRPSISMMAQRADPC
eukprot:SAG31_NODE_241_length_19364_cov_17.168544_7_plen_487_part_00